MSLFSAMADENSVWARGSALFNISSPLNDLLEKDDFTLEQVLQEDELIQEVKTRNTKLLEFLSQEAIVLKLIEYVVKTRNTKLLEFLSQEAIVLKLIEYVVKTPEDPSDDLRALKYPYMACEVICCDIMSITETVATASDGKIVEALFEFLYTPGDLDPRLAGYFEKIVTMLMVRKPQEMTNIMNKNSEKLLKGFVRHVDSFSVSELLKRLLQPYQSDYMDDMDFPGMSMGFPPSNAWYNAHDDDDISVGTPTSSKDKSLAWQYETTVVDLLIDSLAVNDSEGKAVDSDVHKHASDILVDIIQCGIRAQQNDPASPASASTPMSFALLEYLETKEVVEKLVALAIPPSADGSYSASSMTGALSVLGALLSRHTNAQYATTDAIPPAVACVVEHVPELCATLTTDDKDVGTIRNQRHQEVPRLGLRRLKLVGLLVLLIQSKYKQVDTAVLKEDVLNICLDLFFRFESVNMLHADVESMVVGILESGSQELLAGLVKDAHLLSRLVEAHEKNDDATKEAKGSSLGYVGHLHRICNMIISLLEEIRSSNAEGRSTLNDMRQADAVLELFEEDQTVWKKWEELSANVLMPIYERERMPLGGVTISPGGDDPYSVMGFNQSDELLNAQFAEMLGASGYGGSSFDTDFDIKPGDTPMMPEIMNDSSSSEEEDDDELARQGAGGDQGPDRWANFESGGSWAQFEQDSSTFDASFDPTPIDDVDFFSDKVEPISLSDDAEDDAADDVSQDLAALSTSDEAGAAADELSPTPAAAEVSPEEPSVPVDAPATPPPAPVEEAAAPVDPPTTPAPAEDAAPA